jgi:hypothetical protein
MPKPIDIKPTTGFMDARSNPDDLKLGQYRYVKNVSVVQKDKVCRMPGWDRLLTSTGYNNPDLHDQLLALSGMPDRRPITLLFEAISTRKQTKLIAANERVIYALNNATGNWKIISDELGGDGARWRCDQLFDVVVFTNNLDRPVYWNFDQDASEPNNQSVATIDDLETLGISKVGIVKKWNDTMFYMNIVEKGTVRSNRIMWSQYQKPLSIVPAEDSIAGNFDLDYDETILGALELGENMIVYTNKRIWHGSVSFSDQGPLFSFVRKYTAEKTGENCLFYPNTLVSLGNEHFFAGRDGFYVYNIFLDKPKLVDWMHKASSLMFDYMDTDNCAVHVAGYNSDRKELLVSYAKVGQESPSETLVFNTEFPFSSVLDHGFSAFVTFTYHSGAITIKQWLLDNCICTGDDFTLVKEGGYCIQPDPVVCDTFPEVMITDQALTIDDGDDEDIVIEDYDADQSENSLCAFLDGVTLSQLCESSARADECASGKRFIGASSTDHCLKEFSQSMYRERAVSFNECGQYVLDGYRSMGRSGPLAFGNYRDDKMISSFVMELHPAEAVTPSQIGIRIGISGTAKDPNLDNCGIIWHTDEKKDLECLADVSIAQHLEDNTRPDNTWMWPLYYEGMYLYWEFEVTNDATGDTGGAFCLSRISMEVQAMSKRYG